MSGIIACIPLKTDSRSVGTDFLRRIFTPDSYEWIAGIRSNMYLLLPLYIVSIGLLAISPYAVFAFLLVLLICVGFYEECESVQMLLLPDAAPRGYIFLKIRRAWLNYAKLFLPFAILFLIIYADKWPLILYICVSSGIALAFAVVAKYAKYAPFTKNAGGVVTYLGIIGSFFPLFLPVTLLLGVRYYIQSLKKLKEAMYACN
jgi:hypothetical protein